MNLLFFLFPSCLLALLTIEEIHKIHGKHEEEAKISEKNYEKLEKAFGQNPTQRKERLQKMFKRTLHRKLTDKQKQDIEEKLAEIVAVKTEKPHENATVDLFEVNVREGVSEYLFQGDMHLTDKQLNALEMQLKEISNPFGRKKRQASTEFSKWSGNTVFYFFDPSISDRKKASVAAALDYLQKNTCVRFVYSTTAANRIRVFNGVGCYSSIGMIGGQQDLSLGEGCEVVGTSAHEFTHALGFWHTQMRSDRDSYVSVDLSYLEAGAEGNFAKLAPSENKITVPYEYGGFMHYASNAFIKKGVTGKFSIVPKDTRYAYTMGNRQISFYDMKMINDHYGCNDKCPAATSAKCANGGTPNPNNCAVCICPHGYAGTLCDQRPSGCGETLTATSSWQSKQFQFGNASDNDNIRDEFTLCHHWITAPAGQKVQVKITYMFNPQCQYACPFNGIEIKTETDPRMTSPRFCCPEFNNKEFTSELNPTPVVSYNRYYATIFTIEYRSIPGNGVVPPAPVVTTTPAPLANPNCKNVNSDEVCAGNVVGGFCTMMPKYTFQSIKYNCGKACGLCGKAASPCVDTHPQCAEMLAVGMCSSLPPMEAEYHCAKTCGFCEKPN